MSSKRAYYYHKNFNWKEINNLFCYDVKLPERLSKRQQILRLYKNCGRRIYEIEMFNYQSSELHTYAAKMRTLREDFDKLKEVKTEQEVDTMLEKYENFIEYTYTVNPWTHDNVSYEWRHAKGLPSYSLTEIEEDLHGYYDKKLLTYYPDPREWQFRDEYPMDDSINFQGVFSPNEWKSVDENTKLVESNVKSPEQFHKEVEELKAKYNLQKPNMWENANSTSAKH